MPKILNPEENGWILRDKKFTPNWFDGQMTPPTLEEMLLASDKDSDNEDATSHCEEEDFDDEESDFANSFSVNNLPIKK